MSKPTAFLVVGLPHAGVPQLLASLDQHRDSLGDIGVRLPARFADEAFRAAVEGRPDPVQGAGQSVAAVAEAPKAEPR
ncbi:MAG TPA: hypothetical protein PL137_17675, partial [Nocardioides sp.]|nr:hypothetical protein [Nocardioides sp.]